VPSVVSHEEPSQPSEPSGESAVESSEAVIELRHPKAVPALHLSDAVSPSRDRHRQVAARAALLVGAVAVMAFAATHAGSCAARLGSRARAQALQPRPSELAVPPAPAVKAMSPVVAPPAPLGTIPSPGAGPAATTVTAPPLGMPAAPAGLVPAGATSSEALLRVQVEGPANYVVDGRTQHPAGDGALHLVPGHHRITVSSPALAFPRTIEVDLRSRESATRAIARGRGLLRVAVTPWAEVTVDGRVLGVTPLAPVDLAEGTHQVALKNGDLGVVSKRRVTISPNRETLLKSDLFGEKR
jgi:serine/threonine-protein kinase